MGTALCARPDSSGDDVPVGTDDDDDDDGNDDGGDDDGDDVQAATCPTSCTQPSVTSAAVPSRGT